MKIYTVAELLEMEPKMPIPAIRGTLDTIYSPRNFTIKKGDRKGERSHVQNMVFKDNTGEIKITNWSEPFPKSDQGEEFLFESHLGKKGLSGLKIELEEYETEEGEQVSNKIVSMNDNAKIKAPDGTSVKSRPSSNGKRDELASRDPAEVAAQAAEGCRLSIDLALDVAVKTKDHYMEVMGTPPTHDLVQALAGMINYHLRDQGLLKYLKVKEPALEKKFYENETPPPADDDKEIPF